MAQRDYDLVLFGATGFTGGLTAQYLAQHVPDGCRWALAGRNPAKLEAVRDELGTDVPLLHADASDPASLRAVAEASRVVATTVGPYLKYGEPLVAACAEAGTDYVDLTGEPEFVDLMYLRYHATAQRTGARLVHACGFDSIPYDLGVLVAVQQLPEGVPITVKGYVRAVAMFSGGTFDTALTAASRPLQNVRARVSRVRAEPRPAGGRRVRVPLGLPGRNRELGTWVVPLPSLDPEVVARSARLLERYGPDFRYLHHASIKRLATVVGLGLGLAPMAVAAQIPPLRRLLLRLVKPGEGPDAARRERSWFSARFVGEGGEQRVVVEVAGGDPGYTETAKMLGESALCLAFDDLPPTAGQVTTAAAMGDALVQRLRTAGLVIQIVDGPSPLVSAAVR